MNLRIYLRSIFASALLAAAAFSAMAQPARAAVMVEAWGYNGAGALGNGTTFDSSVPVVVSGLSDGVTAIAGGASHNMALQNGGVYDWGSNFYGQLGNNLSTNSSVPVAVTGPPALSSGVTAIASGSYFGMALKNGGVYTWGSGRNGELGNNAAADSPVPVAVSGLSSGVTAIAGGYIHGLAVQNGGVYAWGYNGSGELGNNSTTNSAVPVAVSSLSSGVTAIAGGDYHSLAVKNGALYAWGDNQYGQLGNNSTTTSPVPVAVSGLSSGVTAVTAGEAYSLALQNGKVYAWGQNTDGQLGDGTTAEHHTPEQIDPTDLTHIIAIATTSNFGDSSYALSSDGTIWDWGVNQQGELGLGNTEFEYLTPQHLLPPAGYAFTAIAANVEGAVAMLTGTAVPEPGSLSLLVLAPLALRRRPITRAESFGKRRLSHLRR